MVVKKQVNFCIPSSSHIKVPTLFKSQSFFILRNSTFNKVASSSLRCTFLSTAVWEECFALSHMLHGAGIFTYIWVIHILHFIDGAYLGLSNCNDQQMDAHAFNTLDMPTWIISQLHQSTPTKGFSRQGRRWFGDLMFGVPKLPFASSHLQLRRHPSKRAWGPPPARPRPPGLRNVCTRHFCQLWPKF